MRLDELFRLLDIAEEDRAKCAGLISGAENSTGAAEAKAALTSRLGSYSQDPLDVAIQDPMAWLTAFLQLTPTIVNWHRRLGVTPEITGDTLADVGRNIAIHRRSHGEFGLETWDWLIPHYTGMMFALGRLNYMLHPTKETVDGVMAPGDWVPSIHIPESGPLSPQSVDESLEQAQAFFSTYFPDKGVNVAVCVSWLLDPYLIEHLSSDTNIASFARRFALLGQPQDDATAALFFLFRTRDLRRLHTLPRDSSLRRLVLDRATTGDPWQIRSGYVRL